MSAARRRGRGQRQRAGSRVPEDVPEEASPPRDDRAHAASTRPANPSNTQPTVVTLEEGAGLPHTESMASYGGQEEEDQDMYGGDYVPLDQSTPASSVRAVPLEAPAQPPRARS